MTQARGPGSSPHRGVLATLGLAELLVLIETTIVNVALGDAARALRFSLADRQWLVTAYLLAFGSLLPLGGRLSDLFGRRRLLVVGLAGFAGASVLGGLAHSFAVLLVGRVAQGVFAALIAPAALAALTTSFALARDRARALTLYGILGASAAALGLLVGGGLTQWATWRWCLYAGAVIATVTLVAVLIVLEDSRGPRGRLDVAGAGLSTGGLVGVVFGLAHATDAAWLAPATIAPLVGGGVLLALFVAREARALDPLVPLRILLGRTRGGSFLALGLAGTALFAIYLLLSYYLEGTLGFTPLEAGLAFAPLVGAVIFSATFASFRLMHTSGPRPLVPAGLVLAALGVVLFTRLDATSGYLTKVAPGLFVVGLGLGLVVAPAVAGATSRVEARDAGAASALVVAFQQIGASLGTALLSSVAAIVSARALAANPADASGAALHGYNVALWWAVAIFAVGAIATYALLEGGPTPEGS
ncbi:MAG: MFS transporter [Acidimicrobiales bacterium]